MSFRRRLSTAILTSLLTCSCIFAEDIVHSSVPGPTAKTTAPELTLQQCIDRALEKNFTLEIERYNPQIAKDAIGIAKGGYDPVITSSGFHGRSTTGAFGVQSSAGTMSSEVVAGVSQQLYTGTTLTASSTLDRSKSDPALYSLNPAYNADLTLSISQSLLSGFGTAVNKAALNRAKIGVNAANLDFKARVLDVIVNTEDAYYNLAFAREQLTVQDLSLELAQRLYHDAKTRRETGVSTNLDVLQAEVGVANARRSVLLAEQQTKDNQDALLALIGQFDLDGTVGAVHFNEEDGPLPVFASSYQMAKQNQPDYLEAQAVIDQLKLDVVVAKNATKPSLSVGAAVGLNGNRGNANDAYGDAFDRRNNSWQVDFTYSYPWGQVSEKARYRQSISTLNREQMRLRQTEQTIEVNVRSAVRAVETNHESVKIAALASDLSQKQYELEKARFDAGLSTSYLVLQAQNDLATARVNDLQAKVALYTAIAALHRIEGSSLHRYGITLP